MTGWICPMDQRLLTTELDVLYFYFSHL